MICPEKPQRSLHQPAWTPSAADYRTAGAETPPEILAAAEALIVGETLDRAAERAARERGWKARPGGLGAPR